MDEREFVQSRQAGWRRLTEILGRIETSGGLRRLSREDVRELGPLYRRAASDLAYARAHAVTGNLTGHLNRLVARSYALLYHSDTRSWRGLRQFFTHDFPQTFRRRLPFFLTAVALMLAGALLAYWLMMQSRDNLDIFVPPNHPMRSSVDIWASGKTTRVIHEGESAVGASALMTNNIRVSILAFAAGILGCVLTAFIMFENGAMLGALAGLMTHVHHHDTLWPGILPHGVVELSATCIAGGAGLMLGWALLVPGPYRRRDALVAAALDAIRLVVGVSFLLIFCGVVEAFISPSRLPAGFKIAFGITTFFALYGYLFLAGRDAKVVAQTQPQMDTDKHR